MQFSIIANTFFVIAVSATPPSLWCCPSFGPERTVYNANHAKPDNVDSSRELICFYGSDDWNVNCNYCASTGLRIRGQRGCPPMALRNPNPVARCPDSLP